MYCNKIQPPRLFKKPILTVQSLKRMNKQIQKRKKLKKVKYITKITQSLKIKRTLKIQNKINKRNRTTIKYTLRKHRLMNKMKGNKKKLK
jgi:hypothetical protein